MKEAGSKPGPGLVPCVLAPDARCGPYRTGVLPAVDQLPARGLGQ